MWGRPHHKSVGLKETDMRLAYLGAASIAAIALIACAKKDETKTAPAAPVTETGAPAATGANETMPAETAAAPESYEPEVSAPTDDVVTNFAAVRTKAQLTTLADANFTKADVNDDGMLSKPEFYAFAAMTDPGFYGRAAISDAAGAAAGKAADVAGSAVGGAAGAQAGAMASEAISPAAQQASAETARLDQSYVTIAGSNPGVTNGDLNAALISRFDAADANQDGVLDDAEAKAYEAANLF
jgi:hypothetical protein